MSVIDDNRIKLLRMKERLLSLNNNDEVALEEYKKVACDIDMDLYASIVDKIRDNNDYINYPLEKQLEFLMELEQDFSEYYNFQKGIVAVCNRYLIQSFDLTDSSLIRIDEVRKRIVSIKKYLENEVEIEKNRIELDRLNSEFIDEEQKANLFQDRVALLDKELKNNVLKAEGRKSASSGDIEYVSIVTEAESLGIDLKRALEDDTLVEEEIKKAETAADEANERLKSAQICYESSSNVSYKEICSNIRKETISIQYKLTFLKILQLVNSYNSTYKLASRKRMELVDLIKERVSLLDQLGIRYLYDPFDRIGLNDQLEIIKAFGNNYDNIKSIRKGIDELSKLNDEIIAENRNYADYFKVNIELFGNDVVAMIEEDTSVPDEVIDNFYSHNKVMGVENAAVDFKLDRAHEKTQEVIKRIYGVMTDKDDVVLPYDVSPSLVIEENDGTQTYDDFGSNSLDDDDDDELVKGDYSEDIFVDTPTDNSSELFSVEQPFEEPVPLVSDQLFEDKPFEEEHDQTILAETPDADELFSVEQPFEEPQLFSDRYDDGVVFDSQEPLFTTNTSIEDNVSNGDSTTITTTTATSAQDVEMPDVFWETSDEPVAEDEQMGASFDEQIAALIQADGENTMVKKLVS